MRRSNHGFTLIETLLVLVVGGMLLATATSFLFSTVSLRRQIEEAPQLGQHAASVARLLEGLIASAEPQQGAAASGGGASGGGSGGSSAGSGSGASGNSTGSSGSGSGGIAGGSGSASGPINWQELPAVVFGSDQALYLRVRPGLPVFVSQSGLTETSVDCYLLFERNNGLLLFWQSERMRREDDSDWERTVLSPLVSAVSLLYYDSERERWEQVDGLEQLFSEPERLPQVMQITFREPGSEREVVAEVLLPPSSANLIGL